MVARRHLIQMSLAAACHAAIFGWAGMQSEARAQGKGKEDGGGNGEGNGGGKGASGGGNGGGHGSSGKSGSDSGDRGQNKGGGSERGRGQGKASDKSAPQPSRSLNAGKTNARDVKGSSPLAVQHRTGIQEIIKRGRYIMLDKRGRTIINRRATNADRQRLLSLIN